jgi:hypothetical protein
MDNMAFLRAKGSSPSSDKEKQALAYFTIITEHATVTNSMTHVFTGDSCLFLCLLTVVMWSGDLAYCMMSNCSEVENLKVTNIINGRHVIGGKKSSWSNLPHLVNLACMRARSWKTRND